MSEKDKDKERINIEVGCPIYIEITEVGEKLKSRVVGFEHKDYIIIRAPAGPRSVIGKLNPGKILVVKYAYQGIAYGFHSHVLTTTNNPSDLLYIAYPQLIAEQSLRVETRYNCYLSCSLKTDDFESAGTIIDISMRGCCCSILMAEQRDVPHLMTLGTELEIKLDKPESDETISIKGSISTILENNMSAHLGIAFKQVDENIKDQLKQIIFPLFII
ncbi:MAG: flagellar brake protein [Pseudohongiella sp.]|jgi:c-di-GMP-binding flagellar brake protein YcgR|nr:flagellar brake protein [Pseudohongiella sp.]